MKAAILEMLRDRQPLAAAAGAFGVSDYRLTRAREADPAWGEQVRELLRGWPEKVTDEDAASYLDAVREGHGVHGAARVIGREYTSLYYRRLNDPEFDTAVVEAAIAAIPPGRAGAHPRPVHRLNRRETGSR